MRPEDYISHRDQIDRDYINMIQSWYLSDRWGIEAGYRTHPVFRVLMGKWLLDWQSDSDCNNILCTKSLTSGATIVVYPILGHSPFPQIKEELCHNKHHNHYEHNIK